MSCAFAYQGLSRLPQYGRKHSSDQVKVRRRRATAIMVLRLRATWTRKHGGYREDESFQSSFQLRDEMRSMR
jgi:hypothetical protein